MIASAPSLADVQSRLAGIQAEVFGLGVRRLALFGSVRRDDATVGSDVDMLVEFRPGQKTFTHFMALGDLLEGALGHRVELVTPEALSPFLKSHILADALDVIRAA
jgi:predicted nucleotidyltransferase